MKYKSQGYACWVTALLFVLVLAGCSSDSPVSPTADLVTPSTDVSAFAVSPPESQVQFTGEIATVDETDRILTFVEEFYPVLVPDTCPIVRVEEGVQTTIEFSDIQAGDLVKVCGILQADGYVRANRIVVYGDGVCDGYDVVFSDTISSIDYTGGTFAVSGRLETIVTDDATVIWGMFPNHLRNSLEMLTSAGVDRRIGGRLYELDTLYAFEDLQPGYVVTVKATIVDESTLLASEIKVLNCNFRQAVEFTDVLASIDYDNRQVTFMDVPWVGTLGLNVTLTDSGGAPIALEGFSVGDAVSVKGVELDTDVLRIAEMSLE